MDFPLISQNFELLFDYFRKLSQKSVAKFNQNFGK
jgi:hypothetical protein